MTASSLAIVWAQLLAWLALEVGLIALAVALLRYWCVAATWRRTFCQVSVAAVLVVTACELTGSARLLGSWATSKLAWQRGEPGLGTPAHAPQRALTVLSVSEERLGEPTGMPAFQVPGFGGAVRGLPAVPAAAASPPPETVADTLGMLWLWLAWAAGAALAGARVCLAQCLSVVLQLRRRSIAAPALVERVQALARALGIRRRVRVVESRRLISPIAFGLIRPVVGLPADFTDRYDAARQEAMLAHELAHLAAHDPFWCLLADAAAVLLWWHPGVWWLRRELHLASEMAADEASLLVADGPRILAECLVELGARLTRPLVLGQLRVSGFRSHLGRRVQRLVRLEGRAWSPQPRLSAALVKIFGPMALTAIVVFCTAWAAPQALTKGESMKMMQLNWKRSLATFALLAAFNGPEAPVAAAQSDQPAAAPEAAPTAPAAASAAEAQATEAPTAPSPPPAAKLFGNRDGLASKSAPSAARGAKLEARLKQIVLDEVKFDGLPLSEVLRFMQDESLKRDPDKTGINFLIKPDLRPVALPPGVDPVTGLPVAAASEPVDAGRVIIKFSLPLRNITMKHLLDAIVMVASHPIEYVLEDYAVVFSARPEALARQPMAATRPGMRPLPGPGLQPQQSFRPWSGQQVPPSAGPVRPPSKKQWSGAELAEVKPQAFNVDFGPSEPSKQVGPAVVGRAGDFWNTVSRGFNDHHIAVDLQFAGGDPSPIEVELINLGGAWGVPGAWGGKSPMLEDYNYPTGNRGGNSTVILHRVPAGKYQVYLYGAGATPGYFGDYSVSVGGREYGRKQTTRKGDGFHKSKWAEGSQYVRFSNVKVEPGEEVKILIRPGDPVTDRGGRTFSDAFIAGLQLVPAKTYGNRAQVN